MESVYDISPLELSELAEAPAVSVAISGDCVALFVHAQVTVFRLDGTRLGQPIWRHGPCGAEQLELSPTGSHLLLLGEQGSALELWDLRSDRQVLRLENHDRRQLVTGAFCWWGEQLLLLTVHQPFELQAHRLDPLERAFAANLRTPLAFRVRSLLGGASDRDTVLVVGRHFSDSMFTAVDFSLAALARDPDAAQQALRGGRLYDQGYCLALGWCGPQQVVVYRDPEDAEEPEDAEGSGQEDVCGLRCLYVRRLTDGALLQRMAHQAPLVSGAALRGTSHMLLLACPDRIELVPRCEDGTPFCLPARAAAIDRFSLRALLIDPAGKPTLVTLREPAPGRHVGLP